MRKKFKLNENAKYLPIALAYERETGYRPSPPTVQRWVSEELIESWMIAGKRMTTLESVRKFVDATRIAAKNRSDASLAQLDEELAG